MNEYDPKEIEPKWQSEWESGEVGKAEDPSGSLLKKSKPKWYSLVEFPYPSGDGLHTGHVRSYVAMDIISRKRRREGFNVLYPIGWDAFGLPAENYAIKTGIHPSVTTKQNTDNFRRQLKSLGISFDWSREVNTTDPKYYKWTQWIFLKFFEKGLAYKAKMPINWCPKDKIGLANEEVVDGKCERCGTPVETREKEQWMLAITKYAQRLYDDLETVDFSERIKAQQRNWIGPSEGAEIEFRIKNQESSIKIFTTRPDTISGATFLVKAGKTDRFTGQYVINPATQEEIPVWEAEYVIADYGTGAIMGVPADDERDRAFADKHKLPIVENYKKAGFEDFGKKITRFKLRDWIFSRQRYWGEPIPIIFCNKCGTVPVPEKDLPVELPHVDKYQPTDGGESPLANVQDWVNTTCPLCGGKAKRETDTMPNWAGSSWYFLRYTDTQNDKEFASKKKLKYWMPVDWYNGGMEHTTLHLLYSRFWNKFLYDLNLVPTSEPYKRRTSHGFILGEGEEKMSKSRGNVINPDTIVKQFGADTLRLYEMFMGPFEQAISWNESSLVGPRRFIEKVWKLQNKLPLTNSSDVSSGKHGQNSLEESSSFTLMHQTIKKVSDDIESMGFNTAVSSLMVWVNDLEKKATLSKVEYENLILLLAPFAPHVAEEIWRSLGHTTSVHIEAWPEYDEKKLVKDEVVYAIQVNGKVRGNIKVSKDIDKDEVEALALKMPEIEKWTKSVRVSKIIVVQGKVVNIVTN